MVTWCSRDEEDIHGNPLVTGFQEDLAPDDQLTTSDRTIADVVELSSDEDLSKAAFRSSSKPKDSLSAKPGTTSVSKSSLDGSNRKIEKISGGPRRSPVVANVSTESSGDEVAGCGVVVRQDVDVDEDRLNSHQPVCCAFYFVVNLLIFSLCLREVNTL